MHTLGAALGVLAVAGVVSSFGLGTIVVLVYGIAATVFHGTTLLHLEVAAVFAPWIIILGVLVVIALIFGGLKIRNLLKGGKTRWTV